MKKYLILNSLFCLFLSLFACAGSVDTIQTKSPVMQRSLKSVVIIPDRYSADNSARFPVVYLLHGHGGSYRDWISKVPELTALTDRYGVILVCPDGQNSWYFDSPLDSAIRLETFITTELVTDVDARYRTLADRQHRAITGLSMGGHGALYLALRHPVLFGQAGSLSGGVDFRPFPNNWHLKDVLGEETANQTRWDQHTVINGVDTLHNGTLRLLVECGTDDFFINVNRNLHQKLLQRGIAHEYTERPGDHTWAYWRANIEYHLLFFQTLFAHR